MPAGTICVSRPSVFGNPFTVRKARAAGYAGTDAELRAFCVTLFRHWLTRPARAGWVGPESDRARAKLLARLPELRGKDLACWCSDDNCHSLVLLELSNRSPR